MDLTHCGYDWAGDINDRKSTSGKALKLGSSLVAWWNKQNCVSISTMDSEYVSASDCARDLLKLKNITDDMRLPYHTPSIGIDKQSAISSLKCELHQSRVKDIDIRHYFLPDEMEKGHISVSYVPTSDNNSRRIHQRPLQGIPSQRLSIPRTREHHQVA